MLTATTAVFSNLIMGSKLQLHIHLWRGQRTGSQEVSTTIGPTMQMLNTFSATSHSTSNLMPSSGASRKSSKLMGSKTSPPDSRTQPHPSNPV
jgi:hypothetical protein